MQKIFIETDKNTKIISVNKSVSSDSSLVSQPPPKTYNVRRSIEPLIITVEIDSTQRPITLQPKNSPEYLLNILYNFGIGMLVDKNNVRRYEYPSRNYFTMTDTVIKRYRFSPTEKGTTCFSFSLPLMLNHFTIKTTNGNYNTGGMYGIKTGLDYFYKRNKYLSLSTGAATDIFGEYWLSDTSYLEQGDALFASLKMNRLIGSIDFGYGIHISQLRWKKDFGDTTKTDLLVRNVGVGPALSAEYHTGKYCRIGIYYQPLLYDIKSMTFTNYQHYLSFALLWQLPLRTPGKQR